MSDVPSISPEQLAALATALQTSQPAPLQPPQEPQPHDLLSTVEEAAQAAAPVVSVINPVAGLGLELGVALLNSLTAMESWLAMVPDGTAKHGVNAEIVNMRQMLQP